MPAVHIPSHANMNELFNLPACGLCLACDECTATTTVSPRCAWLLRIGFEQHLAEIVENVEAALFHVDVATSGLFPESVYEHLSTLGPVWGDAWVAEYMHSTSDLFAELCAGAVPHPRSVAGQLVMYHVVELALDTFADCCDEATPLVRGEYDVLHAGAVTVVDELLLLPDRLGVDGDTFFDPTAPCSHPSPQEWFKVLDGHLV